MGSAVRTSLVAFAILAAAVGYVAARWHRTPSGPILSCPALVTVQGATSGQPVQAKFEIRNVGDADLTITEPTSHCACAGLQSETNGRWSRFESLTLQPGQGTTLSFAWTIREQAGGRSEMASSFRTNDPKRSEVHVRFEAVDLLGNWCVTPDKVYVPQIVVGMDHVQTISIHDAFIPPRTIDRIEVSQPATMSATLTAVDATAAGDRLGRPVAGIRLTLTGSRTGRFTGRIDCFQPGHESPAFSIPATWIVEPPVRFFPSEIVLPLKSVDGPVNEATAMLVNHLDSQFTLSVVECDVGVTVDIERIEASERSRMIRVKVADAARVKDWPVKLAFEIKSDRGTSKHELLVRWSP